MITASGAPPPSLLPAAIEHVKNGRNPTLGTIDGSFPGAITSSVISTATPSARPVTVCAIGNAYGGLPSNLIFPMDRFLVAYRPRDSRFSPLAHRGARVIGTDTPRISVVLHVSSDDQEREQNREDEPNVNAHRSKPCHGSEFWQVSSIS